MAQLKLTVVTPEATVRDESVDFVAVPLFDGELGVSPGHAPMIGRLGFGELRLKVGGKVSRYYVDGGFVQVVDNVVAVLTNRAVPAESLNVSAAREQVEAARARVANTPETHAQRERAEQQARAILRVAERN